MIWGKFRARVGEFAFPADCLWWRFWVSVSVCMIWITRVMTVKASAGFVELPKYDPPTPLTSSSSWQWLNSLGHEFIRQSNRNVPCRQFPCIHSLYIRDKFFWLSLSEAPPDAKWCRGRGKAMFWVILSGEQSCLNVQVFNRAKSTNPKAWP